MYRKFRPQNQLLPPCFIAPLHGLTDYAWCAAVVTAYPTWERSFIEFCRVPSTPFSSNLIKKMVDPPWLAHYSSAQLATIIDKVGFQILASAHSRIEDFMPLLKDIPFKWLDFNLGCSTGMVQKHGGGAALLNDLPTLQKILHTIRQAWSYTFSIKIRPGIKDVSILYPLLEIAQAEHIDVITVHGRLVKEDFRTPAHPSYIAQVAHATNIAVIANGDLQTIADGHQIMDDTGAHGVMYGRAAVGRPWLIEEYQTQSRGRKKHPGEPYLQYAHLITDAWHRAELSDTQILSRLKAISHWWPSLSPELWAKLLHQTTLRDFLQRLEEVKEAFQF